MNEILTILLVVAALASSIAALMSWNVSDKIRKINEFQLVWEAYRDTEENASSNEFLEIHGLNEQILAEHGLTKEKLKQYLIFTNLAWRYRLSGARFNKFNKKTFKEFEDGIEYLEKKNILER